MADSPQLESITPANNNLPVAIIHRLPNFTLSLIPWVKDIVNPIELSDPLYPIHGPSARALIVIGPSPLKSEHLDQYPSVECVFGTSAGIDHVDLAECRRRNIRVTSAGDAFSEDGADYAIGLLIDVLRRFSASDRYVRAGLWPVKGDYPLGNKELVKFLVEGKLGGAGLDVFEKEPDVPKELFTLDNVVLSPHKAILTPESFSALREVVIGNLKAFFSNKPLLSELNLSDY